jgi:hypothetical protein
MPTDAEIEEALGATVRDCGQKYRGERLDNIPLPYLERLVHRSDRANKHWRETIQKYLQSAKRQRKRT